MLEITKDYFHFLYDKDKMYLKGGKTSDMLIHI